MSTNINPCPKCFGTDIEIHNCGYSSFNAGHARCKSCNYKLDFNLIGWDDNDVIEEWNDQTDIRLIIDKAKLAIKNHKQKIIQLEKEIKRLSSRKKERKS